jgi:hypothetical protein
LHCQLEPQGAKSDLKVFAETNLEIDPKIKLKADLGYQGIAKLHANSKLPHKKPKKGKLTKKQKQQNRKQRRKRVKVEHVIRRCKCFRIVKETYRNHRRHLHQVWLIVCGLVNLAT